MGIAGETIAITAQPREDEVGELLSKQAAIEQVASEIEEFILNDPGITQHRWEDGLWDGD